MDCMTYMKLFTKILVLLRRKYKEFSTVGFNRIPFNKKNPFLWNVK